ncbi:MAG: asparagine synthetase B [Candidatus Latescibacterota bacterium]|nr:asparagine synthetase B [Candidatus Latescibacterota bacterium]
MVRKTLWVAVVMVGLVAPVSAERLLIPMDLQQTNHLKAYGLAFWILEHEVTVEWLLNYRGGAFSVDAIDLIAREAQLRGVSYQRIDEANMASVYAEIDAANMDVVRLEKSPRIAVYTPPNSQPWDDAVTMALEYASINYEKLWDEDVLSGKLSEYDWIHLHHEDFTGQYGKFYASFRNDAWYRDQQRLYEADAARLGFTKVWQMKHAVAQRIYDYVAGGGFLFAMCSATDTFDIALAAGDVDIVATPFDGDPPAHGAQQMLDYSRTVAFEGFRLETHPMVYEHSDVDTTPRDVRRIRSAEAEYFTLFEFSAKHDPVPTMLTQCHTNVVNGFLGQTTAFKRHLIKDAVVRLAEEEDTDAVKYIHGQVGRGTFTFYGGHDPEDHKHHVGDPATQLSLFPNSPGYRLILNNVLFPAAKKKPRKT